MLQIQQYSFVSTAFYNLLKKLTEEEKCMHKLFYINLYTSRVFFISSYGLELPFGVISLLQYPPFPIPSIVLLLSRHVAICCKLNNIVS